jgi:plastocyanin
MGTQGTYSYTFRQAGTFDYICSIHPSMHGTVVVTA